MLRPIGSPVGAGPTHALGLLLLAASFLLVGCAAAAAPGKLAPAAVFATEAVRFVLAGVYNLGGPEFWQNAAGVVGLAVTALAGYAVWAAVLEDARGREILPLGRRGTGPGDGEAGVRSQL